MLYTGKWQNAKAIRMSNRIHSSVALDTIQCRGPDFALSRVRRLKGVRTVIVLPEASESRRF